MFSTTQRSHEDQIAWEVHRRARVAVLAIGSGILYELSSSIQTAVQKGIPSVGLIQGLTPALHSVANPSVSPAAAEVQYLNTHNFGAIAGAVITAFAAFFLVVALAFVVDATRFRRPGALRLSKNFLIVGGLGYGIVGVAHEVVSAIESHKFVHAGNLSNAAVVHALTTNTPAVITTYVGLPVALALGGSLAVIAVNAGRVGLAPKIMGYIGVFAGVLIVLPVPPFQLLTALWLAAVGFLLMGRWPGGDPPAWEQGVAIPWPSAAEKRAMADGVEYVPPTGGSRGLFGPRRPRGAAAEPVAAVGDTTPEPMAPPHPRSNKRKSRRRDR